MEEEVNHMLTAIRKTKMRGLETLERLRHAEGCFRVSDIISQALYIAIEELKKVKEPWRENSNINDMEILQNLFPSHKLRVKAFGDERHFTHPD